MRFSRSCLFCFSWAFDWNCRLVYGWVGWLVLGWFWGLYFITCLFYPEQYEGLGIGIPRLSSL